jgi:formate dehydrogenase maturation protein FdhE
VSRPVRGARPDTREVAELKALAERQPELSAAANLQIELVDAVRRVQARVATASITLTTDVIQQRLAGGQRLVDFDVLPIEWNEARLLFRQITDVLRRHDAVDHPGASRLHDLGRSPDLPGQARRWFDAGTSDGAIDMLDEVMAWSMRPFLTRTADVIQQRVNFAEWRRGTCPICAGEPDLAFITTQAERLLVCSRCQTRWPTDPNACPFCGERDRQRITSFATQDGTYRVTACQTCRRYLKTLDGRRAGRPVMPALDSIATLPLDAVVMQRGFSNG